MESTRWSVEQVSVQRAISYVRRRGSVTTEQMIEWDFKHGKSLFTWDDEEGARQNRLQEARRFLNHFDTMFKGMRARAFYHLPRDPAAGVEERQYVPVEKVVESAALRDIVVGQLTRRMKTIAAELKFWELGPEEQQEVLREVRYALGVEEGAAA